MLRSHFPSLVVIIYLFIGGALVALANIPTEIRIGGLFAPYNSSGERDEKTIQHLAAFVMAIGEINDKSDGVADDLLPNTTLTYAIRGGRGIFETIKAVESLQAADFTSEATSSIRQPNGVDALVGALGDEETMISNRFMAHYRLNQVHALSTATELGIGSSYPYKAQTTPIDSYQGMVWQHIMCNYYKIRKFAVIATSDMFGSKATIESNEGVYCEMDWLAKVTLRGYTSDFSDDIDLIMKSSDASVFFLAISDPLVAGALLEQGYNKGLFHTGTQIFAPESLATSALWKQGMSSGADVVSIMKGFIATKFWPRYSLTRTPEGRGFISRWRQQDPTINSANSNCSSFTDSTGYAYLVNAENGQCAGLNFTAFAANGSDLSAFAAYTYDAVYVVARAMHSLLYERTDVSFNLSAPIDGDLLRQAILNNVSFEGATGTVDIYEGMTAFDDYAAGDREQGHHYKLVNFNKELYRSTNGSDSSFAYVGYWSVEEGTTLCSTTEVLSVAGETLECFNITYNTADGLPPSDLPPYKESRVPAIVKVGGMFSPFDVNGNVDPSMVHRLAAFLMAVEEINDKNDGVADDLLPNTLIKVAVRSPYGK
jgi:hypothetical protein